MPDLATVTATGNARTIVCERVRNPVIPLNHRRAESEGEGCPIPLATFFFFSLTEGFKK